jgi:hypothetical protein
MITTRNGAAVSIHQDQATGLWYVQTDEPSPQPLADGFASQVQAQAWALTGERVETESQARRIVRMAEIESPLTKFEKIANETFKEALDVLASVRKVSAVWRSTPALEAAVKGTAAKDLVDGTTVTGEQLLAAVAIAKSFEVWLATPLPEIGVTPEDVINQSLLRM